MRYRIVEDTIEVCNGYRCWKERMFMAQRHHTALWGCLKWWWPVINAEWRPTRNQAEWDAQGDMVLRLPARKGGVIRDDEDGSRVGCFRARGVRLWFSVRGHTRLLHLLGSCHLSSDVDGHRKLRPMREIAVEMPVVKIAERHGYYVRKVRWEGRRHAPDRLFARRDRGQVYIEFKRPGERPRRGQEIEHEKMRKAGIEVHVCDSISDALAILWLTPGHNGGPPLI